MNASLWSYIKSDLKSELPSGAFKIWIEPIQVVEENPKRLVLGCPNSFSRNWVAQNYGQAIRRSLALISGEDVEFELAVSPLPKKESREGDYQPELPYEPGRLLKPRSALNGQFTFDSFITGPSNVFAHQAAKELALGGGMAVGALYLAADTGLGKSHLSQAVGWSVFGRTPRYRVMYLTAEEFTNQMVSAIRGGRAAEFKNRFRRRCDALILEDVQFLSGKDKTQSELAHTLDALISDGKRVVFTSSRLPNQIPSLRKELASRLMSGLVATIGAPDFDTRVRIVLDKARRRSLNLNREVAEVLAGSIKRDVRRLESALLGVAARSRLMNRPVTVELAREVLGGSGDTPELDIEAIVETVSRHFKITPEELMTRSRIKRIAEPRTVALYLCREFTDRSLAEIGRHFGRKHSTVLYAVSRVEKAIHHQTSLGRKAEYLRRQIEKRL